MENLSQSSFHNVVAIQFLRWIEKPRAKHNENLLWVRVLVPKNRVVDDLMNTNTRFHKHIKNLAIIIGITMSLHGRLGSLLLQSTTMTNKIIQEMQSLARAKKHRKHINDLRRTAIMEVKVIRSGMKLLVFLLRVQPSLQHSQLLLSHPRIWKIIHKTEHTKVKQEVRSYRWCTSFWQCLQSAPVLSRTWLWPLYATSFSCSDGKSPLQPGQVSWHPASAWKMREI